MPKRLTEFFVVDVLVSFDIISRHMKKIHNALAFVKNETVFIVVTRELEILGEAINNFLKDENLHHLAGPTWREVVDFRNVISHEYFGLNYEEIFDIVTNDLSIFGKEVFDVVKKIKDSENFKLAISETKNDFVKIGRNQSVRYLKNLEQQLYKQTKKSNSKSKDSVDKTTKLTKF